MRAVSCLNIVLEKGEKKGGEMGRKKVEKGREAGARH